MCDTMDLSEVSSLQEICQCSIILHPKLLRQAINGSLIPTSIHLGTLSTAIKLVQRFEKEARLSIIELVSNWPKEDFNVKESLSDVSSILGASPESKELWIEFVMEGILSLHPKSKLRNFNCIGFYIPTIFQLPLISLPKESVDSADTIRLVLNSSEKFHLGEDLNIESVIKWKLENYKRKNYPPSVKGNGLVLVHVEVHLTLTDWMQMADVMLGLLMQSRTSFRIHICKLAIDNYHSNQTPTLRWLLSLLDKQKIESLGIYGERKSVNLAIYNLHNDIKDLSLKIFSMATSGPKLLKDFYSDQPSEKELVQYSQEVFSSWLSLEEIYFNRVIVTNQLQPLLSVLINPLHTIFLYANELSHDDIIYLSLSHHMQTVKHLTIEKTKLRGMQQDLCTLVSHAKNLECLNFKDTELKFHEKVALLAALSECSRLETLVLHESQDMVSMDGYDELVQLSCLIGSLKKFYVFPFSYKPFETFYRKDVQESCQEVLFVNGRPDIELFY